MKKENLLIISYVYPAQKNSHLKTNSKKKVDDLLLEQQNSIICTQDKKLKERLKNGKIAFITIRQKKYLMTQDVL